MEAMVKRTTGRAPVPVRPRVDLDELVARSLAARSGHLETAASSSSLHDDRGMPKAGSSCSSRGSWAADAAGGIKEMEMQLGRGYEKRPDQPVVKKFKRGSMDLALSAATTDASKREALDDLRANFFSKSNDEPREIQWKRWLQFHGAWFGPRAPPLPLSVVKVEAIASMFRKGKYRSYHNYIGRARDEHVAQGFPMPPDLVRMIRVTIRAVERGQGPAAQAAPYPLDRVASLRSRREPFVDDGPVFPVACMVGGAFFMTREIEAGAADVKDLWVDRGAKTVYWKLPASKTDTKGAGVTRSWGCVCQQPGGMAAASSSSGSSFVASGSSGVALAGGSGLGACPFCSLCPVVQHHVDHGSPGESPLFPTADGRRVEKSRFVKSIEHGMKLLGFDLVDEDGDNIFGGHSPRVAGAQHMAELGVDLPLIQLMGRWGSSVVMRYVAEAPLARLTQKYRERAVSRDLESMRLSSLTAAMNANDTSHIDDLRKELEELAMEFGMLRTMVADDIAYLKDNAVPGSVGVDGALYIRVRGYVKWHLSVVSFPAAPAAWKTGCGKRYASVPFDRRSGDSFPVPPCLACQRYAERRRSRPSTSGSSASASS